MLEPESKKISPEVYFELEAAGQTKHEYYHGEVFAMTGATHHHNIIALNVAAALHHALYDRDCVVYVGDMKIQVDPARHYVYPDVAAICGDIEFVGERKDIVANPQIIVEVLSESTQDYDRGSKFRAYREMASLVDYILVDQFSISVEHFHREESGRWTLQDLTQMDDSLAIQSLDIILPLKRIYHRVEI